MRSRLRNPPPSSLSSEPNPVGIVSPVISPGRCASTRSTRLSSEARFSKRRAGEGILYKCNLALRAATVTASAASTPSTSRAGAVSWLSTSAAAGLDGLQPAAVVLRAHGRGRQQCLGRAHHEPQREQALALRPARRLGDERDEPLLGGRAHATSRCTAAAT